MHFFDTTVFKTFGLESWIALDFKASLTQGRSKLKFGYGQDKHLRPF